MKGKRTGPVNYATGIKSVANIVRVDQGDSSYPVFCIDQAKILSKNTLQNAILRMKSHEKIISSAALRSLGNACIWGTTGAIQFSTVVSRVYEVVKYGFKHVAVEDSVKKSVYNMVMGITTAIAQPLIFHADKLVRSALQRNLRYRVTDDAHGLSALMLEVLNNELGAIGIVGTASGLLPALNPTRTITTSTSSNRGKFFAAFASCIVLRDLIAALCLRAEEVIDVNTKKLTQDQKTGLDHWTTRFCVKKPKRNDTCVMFTNLFLRAMVAEKVFTNHDTITKAMKAARNSAVKNNKIGFIELFYKNAVYAIFIITTTRPSSWLSEEKLNR